VGSTSGKGKLAPDPVTPDHCRADIAPVLLLDNDVVREVLTPRMTREALQQAYRDLALGEAVCRPRIDIRIPTSQAGRFYQWGTMEGGSTRGYFAIRMKSDVIYEETDGAVRTQEKFAARPGLFCGLILLTRIDTGAPLALLNDGVLQHLRVAADSAIGTDVMARPGAARLGMLGSGGMARAHVAALKEVRDIVSIRVYSPTPEHRRRFAEAMREEHGIPTTAVDDARAACGGADIVAACTDSAVPVLRGEWLEPGMHVISIGGRPDASARRRFDRRLRLGTAPAPVGRDDLGTADEYLGYLARPADPVWCDVRLGQRAPVVTGDGNELMYADVLAGRAGRERDSDITYSERGNIQGAQFYAVAAVAYEEARRRGLGHALPGEWFLQNVRD
jgi:ornithine cyclodeaminase/alanine dehydrogenase-like protein (mu-crystallin family)